MKCVFCGKEIKENSGYWGNSCWPIYEDEKVRCCDGCNRYIVFPARTISDHYDHDKEFNTLEDKQQFS